MQRDPALRAFAFNLLLPAGLFFYFGWINGGIGDDPSNSNFYNQTVHAFNFTMEYGCFAYVAVAALYYMDIHAALLIDALLTAACAVVFLSCAISWSSYGYQNGYLQFLFAPLFAGSAWRQFRIWRSTTAPSRPTARVREEAQHPASIRSDVLPSADEPPPAEGYLAALAREKRNKSRADHE